MESFGFGDRHGTILARLVQYLVRADDDALDEDCVLPGAPCTFTHVYNVVNVPFGDPPGICLYCIIAVQHVRGDEFLYHLWFDDAVPGCDEGVDHYDVRDEMFCTQYDDKVPTADGGWPLWQGNPAKTVAAMDDILPLVRGYFRAKKG